MEYKHAIPCIHGDYDCEECRPPQTRTPVSLYRQLISLTKATPWKVCPGETRTGKTYVLTSSPDNREYGAPIGNIHNKEHADFIVKCVNARQELIKAMRKAIKRLRDGDGSDSFFPEQDHEAIEIMEQAIAKAERP